MRRPASIAAAAFLYVVAAAVGTAHAFDTNVADVRGGEPEIAVSPAEPSEVVVAYGNGANGDGVGVAFSRDHGTTWQSAKAPSFGLADPFVTADATGRFYAGAAGNGVGTSGLGAALNTLEVTRSSDGGKTWGPVVTAMGPNADLAPSDGGLHRGPAPFASVDRPWATADAATGTVYVSAVDHSDQSGGTSGPWELNLLACKTAVFENPFADCGRRYVAASHDHGASWGPAYPMDTPSYPAGFSGGFSGNPAGAHGVLATAYLSSRAPGGDCRPCVIFETSRDDGRTWAPRLVPGATAYLNYGIGPVIADPSLVTHKAGYPLLLSDEPYIVVEPYFAADPSRPGRYALMLFNKRQTKLLVYVTHDSGRTWSQPASIGQDDVHPRERPWMAYGPSGALGVMYRTDYEDGSYDAWAAVSPKGDASFLSPVRLSSAKAAPPPNQDSNDDASYVALDAQYLHASWGDMRPRDQIEPWYGRYRFSAAAP